MEANHVTGDLHLLQTVDDAELHQKFVKAQELLKVDRPMVVPFIGPPLPALTVLANRNYKLTPEERYQRKCHAIRRDGRRCARWAIAGTYFCTNHTYGSGNFRARTLDGVIAQGLAAPMGMVYDKFLGPNLKEAVHAALNIPITEQKNLQEEVAVARGLLARSLQVLGAVEKAKSDPAKAEKVSLEMEMTAIKLAREGLNGVADLVTKLTAIEKASDGQLSTQQLSFFVQNLLRIIFEVLGDEHRDLAMILADRVKSDLVIPGQLSTTGQVRRIPAPISDSPPVLRAGDMDDESESEDGVDKRKIDNVARNSHDIVDQDE